MTITGSNDAAVLSSAVVGLTETDAVLTTGGTLTNADVDNADTFVAQTNTDGTYGTFSIGTDGVWSYTADEAFDELNTTDTRTDIFTVAAADGTLTSVTVTITGSNDAPLIVVGAGDTAASTVAETNAGLTQSGKLTVTDADTTDTISSAVSGVVATGTTGGLTNAALLAMLSVTPISGLAANTGDANNLTWNFNSGSQAFDFLNVGQSLVLTYTISSTDPHGASDSQTVAITITGTADGASIPAVFTGADPNDFDNQATGSGVGIIVNDAVGNTNSLLRGGSGNDTISAFSGNDTVYGGAGADLITGDNGTDLIYGGSGSDNISGGQDVDSVYGGSGNDVIAGGSANDNIYGGYGADTLTGDSNNDVFIFLDAKDTGDTITDFSSGTDGINLVAIDANTGVGGDQAFTFGGTTATANGVWYMVSGGNSTVYIDTNGNIGGAELVIFLTGVTSLLASDFNL